jgi:FtsP/CotA-like multicopper oxidase with cupredoxin domain
MASDALVGKAIASLQQLGKLADQNAEDKTKGYEVSYELFSINGRMLGQGDPIRMKEGERVLFHVLNASATEIRSLALPSHLFRVVALDGNPVPTRCARAVVRECRTYLRNRRDEASGRLGHGRSRR